MTRIEPIYKSKQGDLVISFYGTIHQTELSNEYAKIENITIGVNVGFGESHAIAEVDLNDPVAKVRFIEMCPTLFLTLLNKPRRLTAHLMNAI